MKKTVPMLLVLLMTLLFACLAMAEVTEIRILATSDLHGMFLPWDYALNEPFANGSLTQLATAIAELRDANTVVLDAGDTIQDNSAEFFLEDDIHPMIAAINAIAYDAVTTGNHEYNFGMETLKRIFSQLGPELLVGNVWDADGQPLGKPYVILERDGVRIGIIGMVSPNIMYWDATNLEGCTVTNPIDECRKVIDELEGRTDVLIGLMHMDTVDEYNVSGSGVFSLVDACPGFDVIIASHGHRAIPGEIRNGVLIVENKNQAQTLAEIVLTVEKDGDSCEVIDRTSRLVDIGGYPEDQELAGRLQPWHARAEDNAHKAIGWLEGGNLTPPNEITFIPQAMIEDTALMDLINQVQLYYTGARVSSAALTNLKSSLPEGPIRRCDISLMYRYMNTLYTLEMNGKQLKQYMEWSVRIFGQYREGDLTFSFDPDIPYYTVDMFSGVNYEVDVSRPAGDRIRNLTWPDGTPVSEEERFVIAVSNYRATSFLLKPGTVYAEGEELPVLIETDVHANDIGDVRKLIEAYISDVKHGVITPVTDHNWCLTGTDWDAELHGQAVRAINDGEIEVDTRSGLNGIPVTVSDLPGGEDLPD